MIIEIVCCAVEDCRIAEAGGADRIELCGGLEVGGMTPSIGMVEAALEATSLPLMIMIRPRGGGFDYTPDEFDTMLRDIERVRQIGAKGVVFGVLDATGAIDEARLGALVEASGSMETMHHRAFDVTPDPFVALEQIIAAGVTRLLTSGRKNTALEGAPLLKQLHERAGDRIEINPAGGIRPENAREVIAATGLPRIHLAPFHEVDETSCQNNRELSFSGVSSPPDGKRSVIQGDAVRQVRNLFS